MTDSTTSAATVEAPLGRWHTGRLQLGQALKSRDNSFNLLRVVAATLVLLSHAFTVVTGDADNEPMRRWLGVTWGAVAVDVFFIASGLLVAYSMQRSDSAVEFVVSRFLRICPGLTVSLVVTVAAASLAYWHQVSVSDALHYVARNSVPHGRLRQSIEGVFSTNPAGPGFNASLWTLPIEVHLYRDILFLWLGSFVFMRHRRTAFKVFVLLAGAYYAVMHLVIGPHASVEEAPYRLAFMFFLGASALICAARIRFNLVACGVALIAMLVSSLDRGVFFYAYSLLLWYVVLCLAYLPRGRILRFNRVGDYSYGIYIYAWPVQQLLIGMFPRLGTTAHIALTLPIVLALSVASWRFVEDPALQLKKRFLRRRGAPAVVSG